MTYSVSTEINIRTWLNDQIINPDNSAATVADYNKMLAILDRAITAGAACEPVPAETSPNSVIAFSVRPDGLIRCLASDDPATQLAPATRLTTVSQIPVLENSLRVLARRKQRFTSSAFQAEIDYEIMCTQACIDVLRKTMDNDTANVDVVAFGEVIMNVSAKKDPDGKISLTANPYLRDLMQIK